MKVRRILQLITDLILALIIILAIYLMQPISSTKKVVFIPSGSIAYVIENLIKKGYNLSHFDKYLLSFIGHPQAGYIHIGDQSL